MDGSVIESKLFYYNCWQSLAIDSLEYKGVVFLSLPNKPKNAVWISKIIRLLKQPCMQKKCSSAQGFCLFLTPFIWMMDPTSPFTCQPIVSSPVTCLPSLLPCAFTHQQRQHALLCSLTGDGTIWQLFDLGRSRFSLILFHACSPSLTP